MKANPLLNVWRFLSSLKLALVVLSLLGVAMAKATFIESDGGMEASQAMVYNARWFEVLLALVVVNLVLALGRWFPFKPRQTGFLIVLVSVVVILIGAAVTRYWGYEGVLSIREGASGSVMLSRLDHVQLRTGDRLASYPVRLFREGPQSLSRHFTVDDRRYRLAVTDFWPRYAETWIEGEGGEPAIILRENGRGARPAALRENGSLRLGEIEFHFDDGPSVAAVPEGTCGRLEVTVGGESTSLPFDGEVPFTTTTAGHEITISEFQGDFVVGGESAGRGSMGNPMIRVRIATDGGETEERMLFAYHPDFAMGHGKSAGSYPAVELGYRFERTIRFRREDERTLLRGSLPLVGGTGQGDVALVEIPAGTDHEVTPGAWLRTPDGQFSFHVDAVLASAVLEGGVSYDPQAPSAARIEVTGPDGESASATVYRRDAEGEAIRLPGLENAPEARVALAPIAIPLPYRIELEDFLLQTYPGSNNPASYESHVLLHDPERGIDGRPVRIYMNHPLTHRGFKHFQSSYDPDRRGTVLSVSFDPGKWPTYVGYALITLGFMLVMAKDLIWRRRAETADSQGGVS